MRLLIHYALRSKLLFFCVFCVMLFFWFRHVSLYYAGLEKEISTSGVGPVAQEIEHKFGVYKSSTDTFT